MKILLTPNATRDKEYAFTKELIAVLLTKGAMVLLPNDCDLIGQLQSNQVKAVEKDKPELVISIGGDGTFLKSAHTAVEYDVPILGFNLGNLGFLAELEKTELGLIDNIFNQTFSIENRIILSVSIDGHEEGKSNLLAINDVVIHRSLAPRVLDITLFCDNRKVTDYRADGIIIATPTGSTGYALSAGGPVTDPSIDCLISVPICAHSFKAYPIVFSAASHIELHAGGSDGLNAYYSLDGGLCNEIGANELVRIKKSGKQLKIMKLKNQTFTEIINKKFIDNN